MKRFNPMLAGRRTGIAPAVMQAHLDSASNAGAKGQAQFYTPPEWAHVLGLTLPKYRNTIVDLTCGSGQLLAGMAGDSSRNLLGCDIEPPPECDAEIPWSAAISDRRVTGDVTQFFPLLFDIAFEADMFALNPPWDLHWYRERLAKLAESHCRAVQVAFAAHDGRTTADTIDSTVATLCMALDLCSVYGEGYAVANNATLERLIFAPDAPHAALAAHVWAWLVIDGNICSPSTKKNASGDFQTGVIYFARSHTRGGSVPIPIANGCLDTAKDVCKHLYNDRMELREGAWASPYQHTKDAGQRWAAAAEEWRVRTNAARASDNPWNIWLNYDGLIRTNLSVFDERANRVKQSEAVNLHKLNGKHPMAMVLQKTDRRLLQAVTFGDVWRVAPAVTEAVRQALADYEAVRAPIVPLNKIQRLGFLDDNDEILCLKSLAGRCGSHFKAGSRYPIRTETMPYRQAGTKMNLYGDIDAVQWEGSELAIYIGERLFMAERLKHNDVRLQIEDTDDDEDESSDSPPRRGEGVGWRTDKLDTRKPRKCPIHHTLQELVDHFEIPEVADVATRDPEGYAKNLALLDEIEMIVNA